MEFPRTGTECKVDVTWMPEDYRRTSAVSLVCQRCEWLLLVVFEIKGICLNVASRIWEDLRYWEQEAARK